MKKIFVFLLVLLAARSSGQSYHEFPDSNAVWNFHYGAYCFWEGSSDEYYSIVIAGDTVINGIQYNALRTPYLQSNSVGVCGSALTGQGAFREDVAQRKVYFIPSGETTEYLLYDFTMQVGDSVKGYTQRFGQYDIVQAIDSVLVGSSYRKRWIVNNCYNIHFIEGIGSTFGLFNQSPGCFTDMPYYTLTCFSQEGNTLFPSTVTSCDVITSTAEVKREAEFKLYPVPARNELHITQDLSSSGIIRITDVSGKMITKCEKSHTIDISFLSPGFYFLSIENASGTREVSRFIKE